MRESLYYDHSGEFSVGPLILGTFAAIVVGAVLSAIYAALILYIPFAGWITFILAIGYGVLLGLVIGRGLKWAKVRHDGIAFLSSLVAASTSFYVSWATWTALVLAGSTDGTDLLAVVSRPAAVWAILHEINAVGAWSLSGFTPTGAALWVLWGLEAVLILAPGVLVPLGVLAVPFCESCERWCEPETDVARLASCEPAELKEGLESRRVDALRELGAPAARDATWIRADLHDCPSCRDLHTLTLTSVRVSVGDDGEQTEQETQAVSQFLVTTPEAETIRGIE